MTPGIGLPEMLVVLVLALVVVGPKQLPVLMRRIGRIAGQARMMARDFQRSFDEIGREAELDELRKEIQALKSNNPVAEVGRELRGVADEAAVEAEAIRQLKMRDAGLPPEPPFGQAIHKPGAEKAMAEKPITEKPVAKKPSGPVEPFEPDLAPQETKKADTPNE